MSSSGENNDSVERIVERLLAALEQYGSLHRGQLFLAIGAPAEALLADQCRHPAEPDAAIILPFGRPEPRPQFSERAQAESKQLALADDDGQGAGGLGAILKSGQRQMTAAKHIQVVLETRAVAKTRA